MYRILCFGIVALLASFLAGCSTVENRIKSNPQIYASLSPADQALVRQGQIREGMPKAAVFLALGNPDRIRSGVRLGHPFDPYPYIVLMRCHTKSCISKEIVALDGNI